MTSKYGQHETARVQYFSVENYISVQIQATSQKPNVVVIVADDMGHHDLSSMGSHIHTPNIDRLSREGVKKRT